MLNSITLVGQPNAGKTTLYNALTGGKHKTANYPGVTIDYHVGQCLNEFSSHTIKLIDTPGINSLFSRSKDEEITVDSLFSGEHSQSEVIISVVDSTQLARHLFLSQQLIDAGFKVVIALTMIHLLKKNSKTINTEIIQSTLNVPVFEVSFKNKLSLKKLILGAENLSVNLEKKPAQRKEQSSEHVIESFKLLSDLEDHAIIIINQENSKLSSQERTQKLDRILLHPLWGAFSFLLIMFLFFTSIFWFAQPFMDIIDSGFAWLSITSKLLLPNNLFSAFITEAIIGGLGSVLVFLPQIVILFFMMGLLEDSGYLARAAVIVDLPLQKIGLSGRSFVPMLSGFACAIPAMLAARTIKSAKERFAVLFVIPLMSCSARLPVFTVLLSLVIPRDQVYISGLVLLLIYCLSLFSASLIAFLIHRYQKTTEFASFALELPTFRRPQWPVILKNLREKSWSYIQNAGTTILMISLLMWFFANFPKTENNAVENSYLAQAGQWIEPGLEPMGLDWHGGVAIIASFAAREVFVSSLIQVYHISTESGSDESLQGSLVETMKKAKSKSGQSIFTISTVCGLIVFYLFALLCFPTVTVAKKEFNSKKMALLQFIVFTSLGYLFSIITVQILRSIGIA
jgi:ferrous iron transport protein B